MIPNPNIFPFRSYILPNGLDFPKFVPSSKCVLVISSAKGPSAATECVGCILLLTLLSLRKTSVILPTVDGVVSGSKIYFLLFKVFSIVLLIENVGNTRVPCGPMTSIIASITEMGPLSTNPMLLNEL